MLFTIIDSATRMPPRARKRAFLIRDNPQDWREFATLYSLVVFDTKGNVHEAGPVKIGQFRMEHGTFIRPDLPETFDVLNERFFSLGQDENYYETLHALTSPLRDRVMRGLRDVADDLALLEKACTERVLRSSLLRNVHEETVRRRFHRLAKGDARHMGFTFTYVSSPEDSKGFPPLSLSFEVVPESIPPTNIHLLIGPNGVGKTWCLTNMARSLVGLNSNEARTGEFKFQDDSGSGALFSNLVAVSFSAFDAFEPWVGPHGIRYSSVGLRQVLVTEDTELKPPPSDAVAKYSPLKTLDELTGDFVTSVGRCRSGARATRWRRTLETLEADPLFNDAGLTGLSMGDTTEVERCSEGDDDSGWESRAKRLYESLSSGHKLVLLTLSRLVETVDERTLVLIDEPEAHLHPPLLAVLVRTLSDLLRQRNGVAIIATHSPIVLREVPKTCVWILRRSGEEVRADRPGSETFGENVGVLTREVFGLDVTQSGFHKLLEESVTKHAGGYEAILERFGGQLGAEARAIARGLLAANDPGHHQDDA